MRPRLRSRPVSISCDDCRSENETQIFESCTGLTRCRRCAGVAALESPRWSQSLESLCELQITTSPHTPNSFFTAAPAQPLQVGPLMSAYVGQQSDIHLSYLPCRARAVCQRAHVGPSQGNRLLTRDGSHRVIETRNLIADRRSHAHPTDICTRALAPWRRSSPSST